MRERRCDRMRRMWKYIASCRNCRTKLRALCGKSSQSIDNLCCGDVRMGCLPQFHAEPGVAIFHLPRMGLERQFYVLSGNRQPLGCKHGSKSSELGYLESA